MYLIYNQFSIITLKYIFFIVNFLHFIYIYIYTYSWVSSSRDYISIKIEKCFFNFSPFPQSGGKEKKISFHSNGWFILRHVWFCVLTLRSPLLSLVHHSKHDLIMEQHSSSWTLSREREGGRENCFVFSERQGMVCGPDINATASREAREAASQCFRLITLFSQENWSITMINHPRSQIGHS